MLNETNKLDELTIFSRDQFNYIDIIEEKIKGELSRENQENLNLILPLSLALVFIYVTEIDFRVEKISTHTKIKIEGFKGRSRNTLIKYYLDYVEYAEQKLGYHILKELFHSPENESLKYVRSDLAEIKEIIKNWEVDYKNKETKVLQIKTSLDTYKNAFNFVGIFDGFNKLHERKNNELNWARAGLCVIGALILFVFAYELYSVGKVISEKNGLIDIPTLLAITVPFTIFVFILLYFFKIILQTMRSIQSQLLQLDLRLTLCRFIQSYAESASELKTKHPDGFEKFESVIFAPLVSSDDKIPNTFDGLDQLSSVVNIVKGKDN